MMPRSLTHETAAQNRVTLLAWPSQELLKSWRLCFQPIIARQYVECRVGRFTWKDAKYGDCECIPR